MINLTKTKKNYDLIVPFQKEFVIPNKSNCKRNIFNDCQITVSSMNSAQTSLFFLQVPKNNLIRDNVCSSINLKESESLITFIDASIKNLRFESKFYPEIEYSLSFKNKENHVKGSFLFNPLPNRSKVFDINKINLAHFKCIDYLFSKNCIGGLYLLSANTPESTLFYYENALKFITITFFENEIKGSEKKYNIPFEKNGIFIDYSFIPSKTTHFLVNSPLTWVTFSINVLEDSLSLEHTLAPHYFIK